MASSSTVAFTIAELYRDLIGSNTNDLGKLQKATAKNCQDRRKHHLQLGENELVLKELDLLNEDANVYKLIGPILVKQDLAEANANVRKRIEYITAELKCLDAALLDLADKQLTKEENIFELEERIESLLAGKAKAFITNHMHQLGFVLSSAPVNPNL